MPDCLSGDRGSIPRGIASATTAQERGRSCGFVKAIIASIVHNDSISRAILRIEGAKAWPASASSNGNTVPCFHKSYGMGPGFKKVFSLACQSRMAHKPQASLCQTIWPVGCKRTLLLDGYNITCKALEISAIIKGSRGKRDSNSKKALMREIVLNG